MLNLIFNINFKDSNIKININEPHDDCFIKPYDYRTPKINYPDRFLEFFILIFNFLLLKYNENFKDLFHLGHSMTWKRVVIFLKRNHQIIFYKFLKIHIDNANKNYAQDLIF